MHFTEKKWYEENIKICFFSWYQMDGGKYKIKVSKPTKFYLMSQMNFSPETNLNLIKKFNVSLFKKK